MDKYRKPAEKKLKGVHPDQVAREALVNAEFASREREELFESAYGDILVDYFIDFLKTEPHESKKREFIYAAVLGLGDVKSRLTMYETYGKNIPIMEDNDERN